MKAEWGHKCAWVLRRENYSKPFISFHRISLCHHASLPGSNESGFKKVKNWVDSSNGYFLGTTHPRTHPSPLVFLFRSAILSNQNCHSVSLLYCQCDWKQLNTTQTQLMHLFLSEHTRVPRRLCSFFLLAAIIGAWKARKFSHKLQNQQLRSREYLAVGNWISLIHYKQKLRILRGTQSLAHRNRLG